MTFKEGDTYNIYRKGNKGEFLVTITLKENLCTKEFNRMLFFKHNIPVGDYRAVKVGNDE